MEHSLEFTFWSLKQQNKIQEYGPKGVFIKEEDVAMVLWTLTM
jgi:hypothetical protein